MAQELLGTGLIQPFSRDGKTDYASASGEDLVRSSISLILGTIGGTEFTEGEMPWRPEFGSQVEFLKFQPLIAATQEIARHYVVEAVEAWEPRVKVVDVFFTRDDKTQKMTIELTYRIIDQNVVGNAVFPSLVKQTVTI